MVRLIAALAVTVTLAACAARAPTPAPVANAVVAPAEVMSVRPPPAVAATAVIAAQRHNVRAAPGFKGKDCSMVFPTIAPELMRPPKPVKVKARAHLVDGAVALVEVLSGPKPYRQPVINAMKQTTCRGGLTFAAEQTFVFGEAPVIAQSAR